MNPSEHRQLLLSKIITEGSIELPLKFFFAFIFPDISFSEWKLRHNVVSEVYDLSDRHERKHEFIELRFLKEDEL